MLNVEEVILLKETVCHIPGAPKIAVLGDFHNGDYLSVLASLRRHPIDIICIPGDLIYAGASTEVFHINEQKNVLPLLRGCMNIAPTFMSLGNHESILTQENIELLCSTGTYILDNEWTSYKNFTIGGLTSHIVLNTRAYRLAFPDSVCSTKNERNRNWKPILYPDLSWLDRIPSGYTILLSHHPEYYPFLPKLNLVLSAHAHGGQWRLFNQGLFAPGQGFFPKYTSGIYGNMIVTRGLTNTARIPRINNPTEIIYVNP